MTDTLRALKEARGLVERGWTQGVAARDKHGEGCWAHSPLAAQWCAVGAASAATYDDPVDDGRPFSAVLRTTFSAVLDALTGALGDLWDVEKKEFAPPWFAVEVLSKWNDSPGRSKNEVLRLYDRAIELCELVEA